MSGYILNREGIREEEKKTLYRLKELELMTTHQHIFSNREQKGFSGRQKW